MIIVLLYSVPTFVKDFSLDISITGSLTCQGATWKDGMWPNVTGNLSEKWIGFSPAVQVKYNRWEYQPTLEVSYSQQNYDFSNWEQPVAKFDTRRYRVLLCKFLCTLKKR